MRIDTATADDISSVALSMRESDYVEFSAMSYAESREQLADELAALFGGRSDIIVARDGDEPVAIGATIQRHPHVLTLLFYATDRFSSVALPLTRFIKHRLFPDLKSAGVHRIECVSIEGHDVAHRWIEALGLKREGVLRQYGKGGETYFSFSWTADAHTISA